MRRNYFKDISRNTLVLSFVSLLNDISSESIARMLPVFLRETAKTSFAAIGWIEGLADSLSILLRLVSGHLADRFRKRKPLILAGYLISALTRPLYPFAIGLTGWGGVALLKAFDRIGKALRVAPRDTLIAAESDPAHRAAGFGLNRAMDTMGAFIGVGVALAVFYGAGDQLSRHLFGVLVGVSSVFGFGAVALIVFALKETDHEALSAPASPDSISEAKTPSPLPRSFRIYLACVCLFTLSGSSDAFLVLRLRESGFSLIATLLLVLGYNAVAAIAAYPVSRLTDRIGTRLPPILAGWLIYASAYLLFAFSASLWALGAGFVAYGLYYGFVESAEKAFVADLVPKSHLGRAYGLFNFALGLMLLPANLIFGYLADRHGLTTAFLVEGAIAAGAAGILGLLMGMRTWKKEVGLGR